MRMEPVDEVSAWAEANKADLATAAAKCPTHRQQRLALNCQYGTIIHRPTNHPG